MTWPLNRTGDGEWKEEDKENVWEDDGGGGEMKIERKNECQIREEERKEGRETKVKEWGDESGRLLEEKARQGVK